MRLRWPGSEGDNLQVLAQKVEAAAPTYFSAAKLPLHDASYVDGGVWANCPGLVAVTEAIHFLGVDRTQIDVLNIGTTTEPFNAVKKAKSGVFGWNKGLINLFMTTQVEAEAAMASLLTEGNLFTINYKAPQGMFSLDDASRVSELIGLGRAEAVKVANMETVKQRFLNGRHAPASNLPSKRSRSSAISRPR